MISLGYLQSKLKKNKAYFCLSFSPQHLWNSSFPWETWLYFPLIILHIYSILLHPYNQFPNHIELYQPNFLLQPRVEGERKRKKDFSPPKCILNQVHSNSLNQRINTFTYIIKIYHYSVMVSSKTTILLLKFYAITQFSSCITGT